MQTQTPTTQAPLSCRPVERAVCELRRGGGIVIPGGEAHTVLALAAETMTPSRLTDLASRAGAPPSLAITGRRAAVLNLVPSPDRAVLVSPKGGGRPLAADLVLDLANPLSGAHGASLADDMKAYRVARVDNHSVEVAAIRLVKIARLLPAAVVASVAEEGLDWARRHDLVAVEADDVFRYDTATAHSLHRVSDAEVPLVEAAASRVYAFRPADGGLEHLAVVIGAPDPAKPVLSRLHSACFTGDLLGSLRCDCGDQLRGAIAEIAEQGSGVLLYLAQEGRGIGLVNKLRAYTLQDSGFDTLEANEQLGYEADERVYLPATHILRDLGFNRIRLMTNNPGKVAQLTACGVDVVERVDHAFPSNQHNEHYLRTKAARSGHLL